MVRIFDTDSGDAVFELKKHTDWVYCVDYSPDGALVASGDRSGGLHVWEAETGRLYLDLIGHKGAVRSLVWRADSNVLLSASEDGTVKMWEMNAGNQLKSFNAHSGGVTGIAMGQDGKIVTSGKDRTVKVWNADGSAVATMPAFSEPALEVAISHDSSRVIGGDWNGRTLMWQISDPKINTELLCQSALSHPTGCCSGQSGSATGFESRRHSEATKSRTANHCRLSENRGVIGIKNHRCENRSQRRFKQESGS